MTTGGVDRLSELSDDLLRRILYFLPSKDAAFTSVLSRRWGSLWRTSGAVNLAVEVHGYRDLIFSKQEAFVRGAKAALDAAEAPITRLTLRVESMDGDIDDTSQFLSCTRDWHTNVDVVAAVVSHQAVRRVEELWVAVDVTNGCYEQENEGYGGLYGLACLPSETLRVLDLTRCDLTQSSSALTAALPLPRLATLRLRFCSVELDVLQALLDAAPELTTVQLESLFLLPHPDELAPVLRLSFHAATTLVLALCGMPEQDSDDDFDCHGRSSWKIEIDAPRLQSFKYKGLMRPFILRSAAPGVARVDLHFIRHDTNHYHHDNLKEITRVLFWQFLHNFTNARTIKLKVGNDLKDIAASGEAKRARHLCAFPRVERLELEGTHAPKSKTAAVAIASLLHCCPALGEIVLKLSAATDLRVRGSRYGTEFLERKDRSDYNKSMDRFVRRRWKSKTTVSMEDGIFCDTKYDDVPGIPGLSGRSFACLQRTLRKVGLQFRLDSNSISSCLGLRLIKFFADHAMVLEEIRVDTGNRRLDEHLNFNVETQIALAHMPIRIPGASVDSSTNLTRSTVRFTVLPLQRQERIDYKP